MNKETEEAIYFFTPAFHPLDNFSAHMISLWGKKFPTAEHAYQWKKFSASNPAIAQQILAASSPHRVKEISDQHQDEVLPLWHKKKVAIMKEILQAKANQHEDVREALKRTGTRTIIENSPVDNFWGAGPNGKGENWVGKIWMEIRESLL